MKGRKRLAGPEFEQFGDRRTEEGPLVNTGGPESSCTGIPPLDPGRAESAHHHVRALNSQFASWVQSQLKNHPDELWQDGVQDYLSHSSQIMDKFCDVVDWLRANADRAEMVPSTGTIQGRKLVTETNDRAGFQLNNGRSVIPTSEGSAACFTNSWSFNILSNNQAFVSSAGQPSFSTKHETIEDSDIETELQQSGSPSLKKMEEKGVVLVHETKCKVYVQPDDREEKGWKDIGAGLLSIKCVEGAPKGAKESRPFILVRNEVGRVVLNALLYAGMKTNIKKNTVTTIFHTLGCTGGIGGAQDAVKARPYLLRLKTEEDANKLALIFEEYAPTSSEK